MKKNIIKYLLIVIAIFITIILYLSTIGLETEKFNNQIKDKIGQTNNKLDLELKKIKLTLDPLNFKINAKTIGAKVLYKKKILELEHIKTQISLISLIKNKFVSSNLAISTKSILLKDLIVFIETINNKPEFIFLENFIKSGYLIANLEVNFDENGKIKQDYKINGLLRDGKINIKKNNFEKINFFFDVEGNVINFKDINLITSNSNIISDTLQVTKNGKNYIFEGKIENKNLSLDSEFLKIIKSNYTKFNFKNINFNSKNDFSFKINNELKLKDLTIKSEIQINDAEYEEFDLINNDLIEINDVIYLKDHSLKAIYEKKSLSLIGEGKIKFKNKFDIIGYSIINNDSDFTLASNILLSELTVKNQNLTKDYFPKINENISLKDHKININYKENNLSLKGSGKIKLEKDFDEIDYLINKKNSNFNVVSNILLSELTVKNQNLTKDYFPKINENISLKDHKININYKENNLSLKGSGKIKLEKDFDEIDYLISKNKNRYSFDTKLNLNKTLFKIDYLNYKNDKKLNLQLKILGSFARNDGINLNKISILEKDNRILVKNFLLDKENKIIKLDKIDLDYIDFENKRNKFILVRDQKNNYELKGLIFNANSLISDLLKSKLDKQSEIFKSDINLNLNLSKVYIDNENIINNLIGNVQLKNNKVTKANISALFKDNENLTFTINTNNNGEKITTLFSARAKPLVKRYKFIKGFEEGYMEFYSVKKDKISKSKLKLFDFKLQELPVLTQLLTLASLQGIADILSGEGIRFNEFEMNFRNQNNLMTIDEIYAIGPAISILMEGYVEQNKLISIKGTLVPATTLNKVIGSIPFFGKILVGKKTGEGVFGVSFKIKGPPKDLKTTVNPIKTLTPRFITRTLEKIKKN